MFVAFLRLEYDVKDVLCLSVKSIADVATARATMRRENRPILLTVDDVVTDEQAMEVARILTDYHPDDLLPSESRLPKT